jgi:penicillin-binding protein-related factor A (putative recombinase)
MYKRSNILFDTYAEKNLFRKKCCHNFIFKEKNEGKKINKEAKSTLQKKKIIQLLIIMYSSLNYLKNIDMKRLNGFVFLFSTSVQLGVVFGVLGHQSEKILTYQWYIL